LNIKIRSEIDHVAANVVQYIIYIVFVSSLIGLINLFFPTVIPFKFLETWSWGGSLSEGLLNSWPIFLWAFTATGLAVVITRNERLENLLAEGYLKEGAITSVVAGFFEEIVFRWLMFFTAIATAQLMNFLSFGLVEWFYDTVVAPFINFLTFGGIESILYHPLGWFVGAAMVTANGHFRDGHKYLGIVGYLNSWFIGFFFFWIMFNFGLITAIVVHFLYDMLIFTVGYIDRVIERHQER